MATKASAKATPEVLHLAKYPKMVQRYFIPSDNADGSESLTEVFRVNTKNKPADGATVYDIITSTGKRHEFATDVVEQIKMSQAERNRQIVELKASLEQGKIDHVAFANKMVELI